MQINNLTKLKSIHDKNPQKNRNSGNFFTLIKNIYEMHTANIIPNEKKDWMLPCHDEEQGKNACSYLFLSTLMLEALASVL